MGISGRTPLATYNYGTNNGKLKSVTYANGTTLTYEYDDLERLVKVKNGNRTVEQYTYDLFGNVTELTGDGWGQRYIYDDFNRPLESFSDTNGELRAQYGYDTHSRLSKVLYEFTYVGVGGTAPTYNPQSFYEYEYGENEAVNRVKHNSQTLLEYTFDSLGRRINTVYSKLIQNGTAYTATFSYKDSTVGANATTPLVSTITYPDHSYGYTYKQNGDIEAVTYTTQNGAYTSFYHYDDLRRLVREDNGYSYRTYTYEYDAGGNILNRKEYSYTEPTAQVGTPTSTDTYTYGDSTWKDLLTSYNGESMVYDAVGNPTTYRGNAMEWDNVTRKLISMQTDDGELYFTYDESGRRRVKNLYDGIDTSKVHFYYYDGSTLLYETIGTIVEVEDGTEIVEELIQYVVDETGSQIGFIHNGTEYYFAKNLQGDVQRIYTANGTLVGEYRYDAWGNHTIVTDTNGIASLNPIRYRSYYYDSESGLYYLNSRYYDPETGRFISADSIVPGVSSSVDGYNLFAYCFNNPVNMIDEDGNWPSLNTIIGVAVATLAVVATVAAFAVVAPAAVCTLTTMGMYMGASYTVATTVAALGVSAVGTSAVVYSGDIAYSAVTGESPMLDNLFQGNEEAYNTGLMLTTVGMSAVGELATQSPGVCFVAGTPVLAACGYIAIEEIKAGDMVWAENPETGEKELKEVVQTFVNETTELIYIQVGSEEIVTTPEHPFYSPIKGWIAACKLRTGDILVLQNGKYIVVERVQHEILENPVVVYNFEVEDFHTYYVGSESVLVHNSCEKMGVQKGNAPRNNQAQNKQFDSVVKMYGLSKKEARMLHDQVSGLGYSRNEIIEELMSLFPGKIGGNYGR